MANWTSITIDDLKAAGYGIVVDKAQSTDTGSTDPVTEAIANAVSRVRRYVSARNAVDADVAKVPGSLKALTIRMAVFALMERIRFPLNEDQRDTRKTDEAELRDLAKPGAGLVESPDVAIENSPVPQNFGNWNSERKVVGRTHPVPPPATQHAPGDDYANPNGPEDSAT